MPTGRTFPKGVPMPFLAIFFLLAFLTLPPIAVDCDARTAQRYLLNRNEKLPVYAVGQKLNGRCAWYGQRAHGNKTASGATFDWRTLTAAHRTLPFGTKVRVTNKRNGRSVVVEVTDRGPKNRRYMIDISRQAAVNIGLKEAGEGMVTIEILHLPEWYAGKGNRQRAKK